MSKEKTRSPSDDPAEYERFLEIARKLEVDESPDALDKAFDKVIRPPGQEERKGQE
jgi:hypothetical protein